MALRIASKRNFKGTFFFFKVWPVPPSNVSYVAREEPLHPKRVPSVFTGNNENRTRPVEVDAEVPVTMDAKKVNSLH